MSTTAAILFFKGVLVLSSQSPVLLDAKGSNVWISDPEVLAASVLGSKVHLLPQKDRGIVFVSGLKFGKADIQDPAKLVLTSAANLAALRKCPDADLAFDAHGALVFDKDLNSFRSLQSRCSFDGLELDINSPLRQSDEWQKAERKLQSRGLQILRSSWQEGKRLLLVKQNGSALAEHRETLGPLAPFYKFNTFQSARPGQTLIFQLTLFEISRAKARSLGIRWPQDLSLRVSAGTRPSIGSGGNNFFEIGADFGEALGIGRVLAQPMLRTLPGEKAAFQSGGEIPIEMKTEKEFATEWKNYGLLLEITPDKNLISGDMEISIDFKVELSEPDFAVSKATNPGLRKRSLSSRFDLRVDEVTVLSSMLQSRRSGGRSGIPGLSDAPFINRLFSKKESFSSDSELWFGIRPTWEEFSFPKHLGDYDADIDNL